MLEGILNLRYRRAILSRLSGERLNKPLPSNRFTHQLLIKSMFLSMGKLSKMDGRVTPAEIKYATSIMQLMGLSYSEKKKAIEYFEAGKKRSSEPTEFTVKLVRLIGKGSSLAELFLKIQCRLAFVKGVLRLREKVYLRNLAEILGLKKAQLDDIFREIGGAIENGFIRDSIPKWNAYKILQLEPEAQGSDIKKAYLRMMSKYHPDKVAHDKLTEESQRNLQKKMIEIRNAYECLCGI